MILTWGRLPACRVFSFLPLIIMKEQFRRRRLPHWDLPGATYFITSCLRGSIPAQGVLDIDRHRQQLEAERPESISKSEWAIRTWKLSFVRTERWLDQDAAVRHFADPQLAQIVQNAIKHFAGERYKLYAYVVMPSHMHCVFQPDQTWAATLRENESPRERIMHSIKSFSANRCNTLLKSHGTTFWQSESYDHCVADEDELARIVDYVEQNPMKAGLCKTREEWPFSSAFERAEKSQKSKEKDGRQDAYPT